MNNSRRIYLGFLAVAAIIILNPLQAQAAEKGTAVVNFAQKTGRPKHLASGTLYGLPDQIDQIPGKFLEDICWNSMRAGGSQTPGKGWIAGVDAYK